MGWNTTQQKTERVEDTNPDVWVRSSEESVKNGNINEALYKIDKAISYSNGRSHYLFEKVKILSSSARYHECLELICSKMKVFKKDFEGTEKLHKLFDYYDEAIKLSMKGTQGIHETLDILYRYEMYEKFVELTERNIRILSTTLIHGELELLIERLHNSISNISGKPLDYYISKIMLLYNYNNYERFLELILNKLSNNFEKISDNELKKLLEYVDKSMNYVKDKKRYIIIRIKILFSLGMYGECIDDIYINMHHVMNQDQKYIFDCLVKCFIQYNTNDMELFKKILVLFERNRTEDFIQVVNGKIDDFYKNVGKDDFDKILKYIIEAITRNFNNRSKDRNYQYMRILIKYKKYDEFLNLLECETGHDFMVDIEREIRSYKEKLSDEQFNRLLKYFYNTIKSIILRSNANNHYKFGKIKFLCNYKKYNECIELLNSCIEDFSKELTAKEYNEALKCLKSCYFRSGKIFSGIGFTISLPIKHPNRYNVFISLTILALLVAGWHFSLLYNLGILKPEIIDVEIITNKKIIAPGETMEYKLQVTTKPKNVWKYNYEIKSANTNIFKIEDMKVVAGQKEGKADLIAVVKGKNQKDSKINLAVKKPVVKSIKLNLKEISLLVGEEEKIDVKFIMNYENAIEPGVKYSSKNPQIAQVDDMGNIRALSAGNTKILVEAGGKKAYITVKVESKQIVRGLEVYLEKTQLNVGESVKINVNVIMNSEGVEIPRIMYSTNNNNVSIQEDGWITALHPGSTSITVSCGEKERVINIEIVDANVVSQGVAEQSNNIININSDFIFPYSDAEELTGKDLYDLDVQTLSIARNEIFARHGFVFGSTKLQQYFEGKSWYKPNPSYKGDIVNAIEDNNAKLIKAIEIIKIASENNSIDNNIDYILPESSTRKLSVEEIEALNDWQVILARNEIFARQGFVFGIPQLRDYFESKYWYSPNQYYNGEIANSIEEYNIQLLKKIEEERAFKMLKNQLQ